MALSSALQHLQQQLLAVTRRQTGFLHLTASIVGEVDGLQWLASQTLWPQFYWQQREGEPQLMAIGEVRRAETLPEAEVLLQQLPEEACLVGANAFALDKSWLFLPRLLWRGNTLSIFLWGGLQDEARKALDLLAQLRPVTALPALPQHLTHCQHYPDKQGWARQVEAALQSIDQGGLEKVVLARATDLRFRQALSAVSLLAASHKVNHRCYHFLLAFSAEQAFLGSSPERLYHRHALALSSEALAGTCANADSPQQARKMAEALLNDGKNLHENALVVEDICQRLQAVTSELDVAPVSILALRKVQHLRRTIAARLHQPHDIPLLQRLQPTAAVAGLPREPALKFIEQHDVFSREWYAGSVGWLSASESEFTVALRSALVSGNSVRLYAGAGIVSGSEASLEWQEINQKASGLASLLAVEIANGSCPKSS
ncbi:isochorismate synthase [Erwinia sp. E_sp_B01_3]|uniref:isochorismate synthase n=1 Tax=unclassified Erwinia TaxID=2622719 RepID=UPI0030D0F5B6